MKRKGATGALSISGPAGWFFEREWNELEKLDGFVVFGEAERLGKDVCCLFDSRDMPEINLIIGVNFADVMEAGVNVLRSRVLDVVFDMFESGFGVCTDSRREVNLEAN